MTVSVNQKREEFKLRLAGVAIGKYSFSILCDKMFFDIADISNITNGMLHLQIDMEKTEKMLNLRFHFKGEITVLCDRCLAPLSLEMDFINPLIVNLVPEVEPDYDNSDDIWMIQENDYELDVFHFVYESVVLALPNKIVHPDDENGNSTCDPEVIKLLQYYTEKKTINEIDPRWETLTKLKLDK